METKTTDELSHKIKAATDIENYLRLLLSQKGLSRAEVVRSSLLDRAYVYQIFSGERAPHRNRVPAKEPNVLWELSLGKVEEHS